MINSILILQIHRELLYFNQSKKSFIKCMFSCILLSIFLIINLTSFVNSGILSIAISIFKTYNSVYSFFLSSSGFKWITLFIRFWTLELNMRFRIRFLSNCFGTLHFINFIKSLISRLLTMALRLRISSRLLYTNSKVFTHLTCIR